MHFGDLPVAQIVKTIVYRIIKIELKILNLNDNMYIVNLETQGYFQYKVKF